VAVLQDKDNSKDHENGLSYQTQRTRKMFKKDSKKSKSMARCVRGQNDNIPSSSLKSDTKSLRITKDLLNHFPDLDKHLVHFNIRNIKIKLHM